MKINMKYGKWLYVVLGIACMIAGYILLPRALQQIVCASIWFYWFCVFIGKFITCVNKEKLEAELKEKEKQALQDAELVKNAEDNTLFVNNNSTTVEYKKG